MTKENLKDKHICEEDKEEEEEYILLELDDCLYSDIQPNAPYILSGLDTLTPTLVVGDGLKMIGEYEETVGTCYLFSESDFRCLSLVCTSTPVLKSLNLSERCSTKTHL
ncbi:general transcription factor 3C polypeptide 6 isoform X5 [Brachypodium distachyon]|uniref:Transcription factor TFIIIC triple barrel domain-containing protein n=1 Tax=Brachypodium distachyon TaxID=15368 RepID=A0A2K2DTJ3_BRADI|nr:general transcription factor 3C polypeptide 6 isoform X5 [Brachypodium distachyon]PNT77582.1 hypothetical protein BRADI_1g65377v3 [Brachypodium distachyon]|eukprot:XP_014753281.1 general transcription factor 3C polypeptide 6 isoform X5 [Brachypodium distachyon]